jgi:cobalamin biosynthesis Co2+ chelatase CbiK
MIIQKAILVVSFGTSYFDALEKNIKALEDRIEQLYSDHKIYRAFTSKMIIKKLKEVHKLQIDTVSQALERMIQDGITELVVLPTHIINGVENDMMTEEITKQKEHFHSITFGMPLLTTTNDYLTVVEIITKHYKPADHTALVLMGHGTSHYANSAYPALDYTFKQQGYPNIFVGTVEGYPEIDHVMTLVKAYQPTKVTLLPLMLVAGDHAKNDMASDKEDSWNVLFKEEGFEVQTIVKGLGELEEIQDLYLLHLEEALR